ncbi:MAG: acetylxylan esterase [Chloroflexota bacterium]|nr:acetylxylan esterase [Chloroflexota bacterium]
MTDVARPTDFDAYWDEVDAELARYPLAVEMERNALRSTAFATLYNVRLTSIGPYRIFGYYSVPVGDGPFPGLMNAPRYGSVNHVPHYDDRERYATLTLMHRGQRLADQPFAAAYPGLLTRGIDNPATYIYRSVVADCVRGAEFLLSRPEVDGGHVSIVGDDLALITAARRPQFTAVQAGGLLFYRLLDAASRSSAYPVEEINDYLRTHPERREDVTRTLAYMDPIHHATRVRATTLLITGDAGAINGPEWLEPLTDTLGGPVEQYRVTHEGATDHDWQDAWMARQLGKEAKPRLWEVIA